PSTTKLRTYASSIGTSGPRANQSVPCGTRSSSTMMVIRMAITPSLKASRRLFVIVMSEYLRVPEFSTGVERDLAVPEGELERILHVAMFCDPMREMDKLHDLYESLADARREAGQQAVPFHRFDDLIKTQVSALKQRGSPEVAFRVALKDGKVSFTARVMRGS